MLNDAINELLTARQRLSSNPRRWGIVGTLQRQMQDNVIAAQAYRSAEHKLEVAEVIVAEAMSDGVRSNSFFMSLLLNSGASRPIEIDFAHGRFRRPNQPGDIVFGDMTLPADMKGIGPFHSISMDMNRQSMMQRLSEMAGRELETHEELHRGHLRDDVLEDLIKRLLNECSRPAYVTKSMDIDTTLNAIASRLLLLSNRKPVLISSDDKLRPDSINRVLEYMHANLQRDMTVPELAQIAGVSRGYFARLFLQTVGQTPKAYLMKIRIELARRLLLSQPDATIVEVATQAGFYDSPHFCREFKAQLGITPTQYRQ